MKNSVFKATQKSWSPWDILINFSSVTAIGISAFATNRVCECGSYMWIDANVRKESKWYTIRMDRKAPRGLLMQAWYLIRLFTWFNIFLCHLSPLTCIQWVSNNQTKNHVEFNVFFSNMHNRKLNTNIRIIIFFVSAKFCFECKNFYHALHIQISSTLLYSIFETSVKIWQLPLAYSQNYKCPMKYVESEPWM